ncbi:unnamed protein product [Nezara viridula]|uniref:non-specific serine/threonine protein kinase n=1 Tax=Nezara viridula TaxID=85310 RepID=A0A9P0HRA9_NEZVI|nr:unnamed protein product [Nezara viridula]
MDEPHNSPWPISKDEYELKDVIGVGATAVVHAAYCNPKREKCAIKVINLEKSHISLDELYKEIQVMASCKHENIVTYYTSFVVKEELWLVLGLLAGGSLLDIINHKTKKTDCKSGVFDEVTIATVLKEVLKGLEYIHNNGQIHRDIKAGNILLGDDGSVQIADFGVSGLLATGKDESGERVRYTFVGTPCWMAPEVLEQDRGYDFKADIWSFGITAIELATGTAPYYKYPPMKVIMLTLQKDPPTLETNAEDKNQYSKYSKTFRKLINDCLQKDPSKRPTATELLKHSFFKKALDKKYLQQTLFDKGACVGTAIDASAAHSIAGYHYDTETGKWAWLTNVEGEPDKTESPETSVNDARGGDASPECENLPQTRKLKLVLRLRNKGKELRDISFEFATDKDSCEGIVSDLEEQGLVDRRDVMSIVANLSLLLQSALGSITFPLESAAALGEATSEKALIGYARISVATAEPGGPATNGEHTSSILSK